MPSAAEARSTITQAPIQEFRRTLLYKCFKAAKIGR